MILEKAITLINYDVCGLIIMISLLFMCFYSKNHKTKSGKLIMLIILCGILAAVFDILQTFPRTIGLYGLWISNIIYFIMKFAILFLYSAYILTLVGLMDLVKKNKIRRILFELPMALIVILIITSPLTHLVFYFKYNGEYYEYTRSNLSIICYLMGSVYIFIGFFSIFSYKKLFNATVIISLCTAYIICLLGLGVQLVYDDLIELFVTSLALIIIFSTVEKNGSLIDNLTGMGSYEAFSNEIYRTYILNNKAGIMLINITNFDAIQSNITIKFENQFINMVSNNIYDRCKMVLSNAEIYYLEYGVFAVIFKSGVSFYNIAKDIIDANYGDYGIKPNFKACITSNIAFQSYDKFIQFVQSFNYADTTGERIITITNSMDDNKYQVMSNIDVITKNAIDNNLIEIEYQPIYSVEDNSFKSVEAFARINDSNYGIILPEHFLSFCERSGRIIQIDKIVVEKVFSFISKNLGELNISGVSINISIKTLASEEFITHLRDLNKKYNINPSMIIFEAKDLIRLVRYSSRIIDKIKKMGYRIAIDNYGVGYYNIKSFSVAPVNVVKIRNDVFKSLDRTTFEVLFRNTCNLIHHLNREVYISNVESKDEADLSIKCGINYLQGNYYTEPLSEDELISFFKTK